MRPSFLLFAAAVMTVVTGMAPPQCAQTFCSTVTESLIQNGETVSSETYQLCMDSAVLSFRQTMADGSMTILNTEQNQLYSVTASGVCTVAPPTEPTTINTMPFTMVDIDAQAYLKDARASSPTSGVRSVEFFHDRPAEQDGIFETPEELMHFYVKHPQQYVESSCEEHYGSVPGDGGNTTVQFGNRDFAVGYDEAKGSDPANYLPDPAISCTNATASVAAGDAFKSLLARKRSGH